MAKYRQISLTIDDMEQNKLGFDLHQMWGLYADKGKYMQIKVKVSALYLIKILYVTILIKMFNI